MCRLYALLANEPTKVECSLIYAQNALMEQSRRDSAGNRNADGWGVVCYDEHDRHRIPTIVKHSNAAFDSDHFNPAVADVYSKAVVAHVRQASVGFSSTLNAHPFTYDEWTFAHNGNIPSFETLSQKMEANIGGRYLNCRLGTTDSELFFLWLLYQMEANGIQATTWRIGKTKLATSSSSQSRRWRIAGMEVAPGTTPRLNFVLTNGHVLFACRWNNPMYKIVRDGVHDCEICGIPHIRPAATDDHRTVIIASEPITSEPWQEVPNHSLMFVSPTARAWSMRFRMRIS